MDRYSKYIDLDIDGITSKDVISISVTPASAKVASYAQFANPETFDGYVRLRAVSVPTTAITAQYYIMQGGGQTDSGSGTVVEGYTKAQVDNKIAAAIKVAKEEQKLLDHPVGSIYQSVEPTSPAELFGGEWQSIGSGRVLMGADNNHAVGTTVEAGLPNITGRARMYSEYNLKNYDVVNEYIGAFYWTKELEDDSTKRLGTSANLGEGTYDTIRNIPFDASRSNSIYGRSTTVQPPAYYVYMWLRTA